MGTRKEDLQLQLHQQDIMIASISLKMDQEERGSPEWERLRRQVQGLALTAKGLERDIDIEDGDC